MPQRTKQSSKARVPPSAAPIFAALGDETRLRLIGAGISTRRS
jgi:hypothetical protein